MFGIFHALFSLFAIGANNKSKSREDNINREEAKKRGDLTYYGSRGNEYLVENNKWVCTLKNARGEDVIVDMKTGAEYYNLTQMRKKEHEKRYIDKGKTVRLALYNEKGQTYGKYRMSYFLVDIESQIPVRDVFINGLGFYISLGDGKILRTIDNADMTLFAGDYGVNEIISIVNKRQEVFWKELDSHDILWIKRQFFFEDSRVYVDKNRDVKVFRNSDQTYFSYVEKDGGYRGWNVYIGVCCECDGRTTVYIKKSPYPEIGETVSYKCIRCENFTEQKLIQLKKSYK